MAERSYEQTRGAYAKRAGAGVSPWAVGFVVFAAAMMIILGTFHAMPAWQRFSRTTSMWSGIVTISKST